MAEKTIESRIKSEYNKLKKFYKDLPEDKWTLAKPLMERAAFLQVTMEDLEKSINVNGTSDEYQNGANQYGRKISADIQSYNALVKSYNMISKRLEDMMPKKANAEDNALEAFKNKFK